MALRAVATQITRERSEHIFAVNKLTHITEHVPITQDFRTSGLPDPDKDFRTLIHDCQDLCLAGTLVNYLLGF